jgi:hypothetical protein
MCVKRWIAARRAWILGALLSLGAGLAAPQAASDPMALAGLGAMIAGGVLSIVTAVRLPKVDAAPELIAICATCKNVKDETDNWVAVETFVERKIASRFTHGMCVPCLRRDHPAVYEEILGKDGHRA